MNKKIVMPLMIFLGLSIVAAVTYYAVFSASFNVLPAITLSECNDVIEGDIYSGSTLVGTDCTLTNEALTERSLVISNNASEGIEVTYKGTLDLVKKNADWSVINGTSIPIEYTIIGDSFEVTGVPENYTAIYYKDNVVELGERIANPQPAISIVGIGNLPQLDDANIDELADYTQEPDYYNQMKGAKLWIVPNEDLAEGVLNWANMANYYYETDLIQYNAEGQIVLYPGASLTVTPVYTIGAGVSGSQTITTTVA